MPRATFDWPQLLRLEPASDGAWWLKFTCSSQAMFDETVAAVRDRLPSWARHWDRMERAWWIGSASHVLQLADVLPEIPAALSAGGVHRRRTSSGGKKRQRRKEVKPEPSRVPTEIAAAFGRLCLTPDAPVELISAARRIWSRSVHPDAGGDHLAMVGVNRAADLAEQWAAERRDGARPCRETERGRTGAA